MPSQDSVLINLPASLEDVKIERLPCSAYYIADFLSVAEEELILAKIASAPKPRWKILTHRRLQSWPSDLIKDTLFYAALPTWLHTPVISRILGLPVMKSASVSNIFSDSPHKTPNHVLINEYLPGQGIMPHKDGSAYHPVVCTVSLGASLCLDIYGSNEDGSRESQPRWRILQEPRSLLITTDEIYKDYLHGIAAVTADIDLSSNTVSNWPLLRDPEAIANGTNDRRPRTSLTYRDVLKVSKIGTKFGLLGKR